LNIISGVNMSQEFINSFYDGLREEGFGEDFIQSISKLIEDNEFSSEKLIELINEGFDE